MDKGGRRGPSHWTNPPSIPWTAGCNRSWSSPRSGSAIGWTVRVTPGRHSGLTILTRFHNSLYAELSLDFVYKAFTTTDLAAAIAGIRALGIRGCGGSMPYKEVCLEFVDAMDASAEASGRSTPSSTPTDSCAPITPTTWPSPSSWPTASSRWITPSPCSAAGHGQRPWSRRSVTRASTQGRWSRAAPRLTWPTSTAMPGGPRVAPAGHSCWSTRPRSGCRVGPPPRTCRWRPRWWTAPRPCSTWSSSS